MAQQVIVTKPIEGTHVVKEEIRILKISPDLHVHTQ